MHSSELPSCGVCTWNTSRPSSGSSEQNRQVIRILVAVGRMLNLFAATGHNNYAKSGRLYLQMMMELPHMHTWLYEQFSSNGFFTVRRSDRFWASQWTDLIIEQVMRTIKGHGWLTHGRVVTESV